MPLHLYAGPIQSIPAETIEVDSLLPIGGSGAKHPAGLKLMWLLEKGEIELLAIGASLGSSLTYGHYSLLVSRSWEVVSIVFGAWYTVYCQAVLGR
jgi:hypothetical protein